MVESLERDVDEVSVVGQELDDLGRNTPWIVGR
jgi:hypothetical protein